jgi:hydrogenase/urease accessory protein HupE
MGRRSILLILIGLLLATGSGAHESRPGYLQFTLTESDTVEMLFKVPARGDRRLGLYPNLPTTCNALSSPTAYIIDGAYTERATFQCDGGLVGETVSIDGLSSTLTDVLVRVTRPDGSTQVVRLTPSATSFVVAATPNVLAVAKTYLLIGVEHILSGIDHLLFILALLILVPNTRTLIWTITAFTVAHSLTLAAATLGIVHVPQPPVEAAIGLSIVFVASEIIHVSQGRAGLTQRRPWIVAFTFGLLHGFGFAGALTEVGLPEQAVPLALLFFNLGVELGQLTFVVAVLLSLALLRRVLQETPRWSPTAAAYAIGIVASYWTIERVVGFW